MFRVRTLITSATVLLALAISGCYATVPVQSDRPVVGSDLVMRLNDTGTSQLASQVGPGVIKVQGKLLSLQGDTVTLAVSSTTRRDGDETFWKGERISAPKPYIALVEQKKLSTFRSAVVGASVVAVAFLIRSVAMGGSSGPPPNKPPNGQ